jgi:excisionase family DNA binding protein
MRSTRNDRTILKSPGTIDRFWTPNQIAERWLVSPRTVRRLIEAGELRACRMGKQIRIRHADLLAYEHGQTIIPERAGLTRNGTR